MKRMLLSLMLLAAPFALASVGDETRLNVPFEFRAGSSTLPAGEYFVRTDQSVSGVYSVVFRNASSQTVLMPSGRIDTPPQNTKSTGLVFQCEPSGPCLLREVHNANGPAFRMNAR